MTRRSLQAQALVIALLASRAHAQTNFPEVEPNSQKSEATLVSGMTGGDTISGTCTGTNTVIGDTSDFSSDVFRVKTAALPLGVYKHRLTLSTATTAGHTGTIRGVNQLGTAGTASTGGTPGTVDSTVQITTTSSVPPRSNFWYGFGKQEEIYYRVSGATATTQPYTAVLSTATVPVTIIATPFESSGLITISTIDVTTANTTLHVFDSNLDAMPGFSNGDAGSEGLSAQSRLTRTYLPGTYYLAVSSHTTAWNFPAPPDDGALAGATLMDFPGSLVRTAISTLTQDWDFTITACNGRLSVTNQLPANSPYTITWFQFAVAPGAPTLAPPPNDNCAGAVDLGTSGGTFPGTVAAATQDGAAGCDPGGALARDVWYRYTNTDNIPRLLSVNTCGTSSVDTTLSIHASCTDTIGLACNDDCGGVPCAGGSSCTSALVAASQTVLVRVSDKGLGGCGEFTLVATVGFPSPTNDGCAVPIALVAPGVYALDTTTATTGAEGQAEGLCLFAAQTAIYKDVWFTYFPTQTTTVTVSTCGLIAGGATEDSKIAVYSGSGCPIQGTAIACNDDAPCTGFSGSNATVSFSVLCGATYLIQIGSVAPNGILTGSVSVAEAGGTPCLPTTFCTGSTPGTTCVSCGNNGAPGRGCANSSSAAGAQLVGTGNASISSDTFILAATGLTGPSLFFQANGLSAAPIALGDGMLCAAVGVIRFALEFPASGVASYPNVITPNPIHVVSAPINPGDTKHYQCWYRDGASFCTSATFNTTNGVSVIWGP